jgi:hypothetical protein
MPLLHIALQEGFESDPVSISVDGQEIFKKDAVRTRTQIGLADSVEVTRPAGGVTIEIRARGTTAKLTPTLTENLYVGVSMAPDGRITHRTSSQPFGYM